ncbi:MAG: type IV toxin-antitoxin system AbiEi family antitoxin [Bryobacteraceae bacterium]
MLKTVDWVKSGNMERKAMMSLRDVLADVPFLTAGVPKFRAPSRRDAGVDCILPVRQRNPAGRKLERKLLCQIRSTGQPRVAREACLELREAAREDSRAYPVFLAPFISPDAAAICNRFGAGYMDMAGNCRLVFDTVFIKSEGRPNPAVEKRDLRSLFSPKAERVLRALVASGKRDWRTQALADAAGVSLGQVANVKKLLADREWIEDARGGFRLRSFDEAVMPLLEEWPKAFRRSRGVAREYYSLKPMAELEASLTKAAERRRQQLGFTAFSGGARMAPAVRFTKATAYVDGDPQALASDLGLKAVSSGANLSLIEASDAGVFFGSRKIDGAPVVSPVQIYLDLMAIKGRGEEAAQAILEQVIEPQWR